MSGPTAAFLRTFLGAHEADLVAFRRRLHMHPELSNQERRTTAALVERLTAAGLEPEPLEGGTGLTCDVGSPGPVVALRGDLDALPIEDAKGDVSYRSTVPGVSHCCGHDVHTTVVLGAGLALAARHRERPLPGTVRLVFQPAEEVMPGGALAVLAGGRLDGVETVMALHCDPAVDAGRIGLSSGPVTAASDMVSVTLQGPGGHTSRPQNTVDLVYALASVAVQVPAALSRLVDPRASLSLVWGAVAAGTVPNAIPRTGVLSGTLRTLDAVAWEDAPGIVTAAVEQVAAVFGAQVEVDYQRGVPPVVNDPDVIALLGDAAERALGPGHAVPTRQSLGGEDFGWYLRSHQGAMARLGTRRPGGVTYDLHQGTFDVDERAIGVGVRFLAQAAVDALAALKDGRGAGD